MITKMSLETTRATIVSIHLRTHDVEMSDVAPAKANGANTAATMMSNLRIIIAPHTTITAAEHDEGQYQHDGRIAGRGDGRRGEDPRSHLVDRPPVAACTNPAESASTAASRRDVTAMAAALPKKATRRPLTARASPAPSWRSTEAMIWMMNRPVATTTAKAVTMARSRVMAEPVSEMAVAPLIWPQSQLTAESAAFPKSWAMAPKAESAIDSAAPAGQIGQATTRIGERAGH